MAAPRAQPRDKITAQGWNQLCESTATGYSPSGAGRDFGQMNHNTGNPSFWCYISMQPPYPVRIMPGWICIEGGVPFLPSGMDPDQGMTLPHGSDVFLNLYTRRSGDISSNPGNPSMGSGDGVEAHATITEKPMGPIDGWSYSPIMISEWKQHYSVYHCKQRWASDIYISSGGGIFAADIPVFIRTRPETGWGPDANTAHNGLELLDESTPDKWQYALALRHADELYSYVEGLQPCQLGGVYRCTVSGVQPDMGHKPRLSTGEIIYPLAHQNGAPELHPRHTFGLIYAAAGTDEPEPYVSNGIVYIPRCQCGSGVGSSVDPSGGGSYNPGGGYIPLPTQPANLLEQ